MKFPNTFDFLRTFGLEPIEVDASMAYCRYKKKSNCGLFEIDISFSAVSESFQVIMRVKESEVITISSEKAKVIEIYANENSSGIRVIFEISSVIAEANITFEPELNCRWWTLSHASTSTKEGRKP